MVNFGKCFGEICAMDMSLDKSAAGSRIARERIYGLQMLEAAEKIRVMDERSKPISGSQFRRVLLEAARAMETSPENEIDYEMLLLKGRLGDLHSPEKQLVAYKLLEHIAMHSRRESIWRNALARLSEGIISEDGGATIIGSLERENICTHCVRSVYEKSRDDARRALAFDILAEALFTHEEQVVWKVFTCIERVDGPLALATIAALSAREGVHPRMQAALLDSLNRHGEMICEKGGSQAIEVVNGLEGRSGEIERILLEGFGQILNARRVRLPHPAYLEKSAGGFPVPKLAEEGRQVCAFRALGRMNSGNALRAIIGGIHQLVVPHVAFGSGGEIEGEEAVVKALGDISDSLGRSLRMRGLRSAEEFTDAILGRPEQKGLGDLDRFEVRRMGHVFFEFSRIADESGTAKYPVSNRAAMGLVLAILSGTEGRGSIYPWKLAAANAALIARRYREAFGSDEAVDGQKRIEFLARIAREQLKARPKVESIALPPHLGKEIRKK